MNNDTRRNGQHDLTAYEMMSIALSSMEQIVDLQDKVHQLQLKMSEVMERLDTVPQKKSGRTSASWAQDERDTLVRMLQEGKALDDIAEAMGRSKSACTSMLYNLRRMPTLVSFPWDPNMSTLRGDSWSDEEKQVVREVYNLGLGPSAARKALRTRCGTNRTAAAVYQQARHMKLTKKEDEK